MRQKKTEKPEMQTNVQKQYVREAIHMYAPGESWIRRVVHFDDPLEEAKEEENYRRVTSNNVIEEGTMAKEENQEKTITTPARSSDECRTNADNGQEETSLSAFEDKGQKNLGEKADLEKAQNADVVGKTEQEKAISAYANNGKEPTNPMHFIAAGIQSTGIKEIRVPEEMANSVIMESEIAKNCWGGDAFDILHGEAGKKIANLLMSNSKKIEVEEITNFYIVPVKAMHCIDRAGNKKGESEIVFHIKIYGKEKIIEDEFSIKQGEVKSIMKIIQKKYPSAIIWSPGRTSEILNELRQVISGIPEEFYYIDAGWNHINGRRIYVHKSMKKISGIKVDTELDLPVDMTLQPSRIPGLFEQILNLYGDAGISYTMLTYAFLGVLYKVFEGADHAPRFLLFISGRTGSYKSAMAKVLYTQLCNSKYRKFPRRIDLDSESSLERGLVQTGEDTVTLIDDFAPPQTSKQGNDMKGKLETVIRMVGDGSTKSRSNVHLEDRRGEGFKGMITITGELRGTGLSSNLRCIYLEIQKELVNIDVLSWLQVNDKLFTTIIHHMTIYVSKQWDVLVAYIRDQYENYRKVARKDVSAGRMIDTLVTLWIVTDIIDMFFADYCGSRWNKERMEEVKNMLKKVVMTNEGTSMDEDPAEVFMRALATMLNNNEMKMVPYEKREEVLENAEGYLASEHYFLLPEKMYGRVIDWIRRSGREFLLDSNQVMKTLNDANYICATANGAQKKTYFSRIKISDRRVKFVKISKAVIEKILETNRL